jgi:hypothetical protein
MASLSTWAYGILLVKKSVSLSLKTTAQIRLLLSSPQEKRPMESQPTELGVRFLALT